MGRRGPKSAAELSTMRRQTSYDLNATPVQLPPNYLRPETKKWWASVVATRDLTSSQYNILQCAAEAWDRYQQAREALKKHGLSYTDSKGMIRSRPEVQIERDSRNAHLRAIRELNLNGMPEPANKPKRWPPVLGDE